MSENKEAEIRRIIRITEDIQRSKMSAPEKDGAKELAYEKIKAIMEKED